MSSALDEHSAAIHHAINHRLYRLRNRGWKRPIIRIAVRGRAEKA